MSQTVLIKHKVTVKSVQVAPRGVVVNILGTAWCNGELVCVLVGKRVDIEIVVKQVEQAMFVLLTAVCVQPVIKIYGTVLTAQRTNTQTAVGNTNTACSTCFTTISMSTLLPTNTQTNSPLHQAVPLHHVVPPVQILLCVLLVLFETL